MERGFLLSTISDPSLAFPEPSPDAAPTQRRDEPVYFGVPPSSWMRAAVLTALFAALFWPNLRRLWQKTNPFTGEANWGHAICVPIIGLYYLYVHREDLAKLGARPFVWDRIFRSGRIGGGLALIVAGALAFFAARFVPTSHQTIADITTSAAEAIAILGILVLLIDWSLAVTFFGIALYVYGIYPGQNDYLKDCGMVVTLFGIVLLTCGREVMKIAWFPIAFLMCAIPWPGLVYSWIAGPLQQLAATVAVLVLKATGVDAVTSGTKIVIYGPTMNATRMLNVAEACAGMRSLMTFIAVAAAVAFLSARPLWQKLIITVSAIPIAIFCNVMRVSGQGLLDHYVSTNLSESFAHQFVGMIMLVPAFFLILAVGWVLDQIFVEEADDAEVPAVVTVKAPPVVVVAPPAPAPLVQQPPTPRTHPTPPRPAPPTPPPAAAPLRTPPPPRSTATRAVAPSSVTPSRPRAAAIKPQATPTPAKAPPAPPAAAKPPAPGIPRVAAIAARTSAIPPLAEQQINLRLPPRPRTALNLSSTTPPAVGRPLGPLRRPLPPDQQSAAPPTDEVPPAAPSDAPPTEPTSENP